MRGCWTAALFAVIPLVLACSDDDGGGGPTAPPSPAPAVEASRIFADAPLEGELTFVSPGASDGPGSPWRFEVDLATDGTIDATGEAVAGVTVPYRFESPGVHPITITLERDGERLIRERPVVVNDPSRIEVVGTSGIFDDILEGVTLDRTGSLLFVGRFDAWIAILDPITLTVLDSFRPADLSGAPPLGLGTLEGFGSAPDEDLLYFRTKRRQLGVVELSGTEVERLAVHPAPGQFYVHPLPNRRAYVGGNALAPGIALIDTETGEFLADGTGIRCRGSHFALSHDGSRIAVLDRSNACGTGDTALVLTDLALVEQERFAIDRDPNTVVWSPSGNRVYVRYLVNGDPATVADNVCGILVLASEAGTILDDIELGSGCGSANEIGAANPVASTPDGRFAVFPTRVGIFLFDTAMGLPVARVQRPDDLPDECCDIAASPNEDVFYVATRSGHVVKLRIRR